jgi:O-antigen/teichoic acid export membrane protein
MQRATEIMVRSRARTVIGNALTVLTSDVVNRATTFVLYALVARHLGAFQFGQMSLSLTLFATFQVFALAGLKSLVTREVAKDRRKTDPYLVNGTIVVTLTSLMSIAIMLLFTRLMNYAPDTANVILLVSLALLPFSISAVCEAVFQAWERMRYIAYANVPVNLAKIGIALVLLSLGYGLYALVILLLAAHLAVASIEWWLMLRHITRPRLRIDPRFSVEMSKSTSTFLGIDGVIATMGSLNIILVSKLANEKEAGLYNAATQLMVPMTLMYQSLTLSLFPMMCRTFQFGLQNLKRITEQLIELLFAIALPTLVGLFFLADSALLLLYGKKEFVAASGALRILVWTLALTALTNVLGPVLVASLREKVTLRIVIINAVVSLVLGLTLISRFGLIGAAMAVLLTRMVDFFQHYVPVSRMFSELALGRLAWKPAVATLLMAAFLTTVKTQEIFTTVLSAGAIYAGILLTLMIWSLGGPRRLKAKYQYLWSDRVFGEDGA